MGKTRDFGGWATRYNIKCADGRTILPGAFDDCDGKTVPLVWDHQHSSPLNVLGHALLHTREDGVYADATFNETTQGKTARELVNNGDIKALSIYANQLKQNGGDVIHGMIREVSLVLAGANPGAFIDTAIAHNEYGEDADEAIMAVWDENSDVIELSHSDDNNDESEDVDNSKETDDMNEDVEIKDEIAGESLEHGDDKTVEDVIESMNDEQKKVLVYLVEEAAKKAGGNSKKEESNEEDEEVKHNVFNNDSQGEYIAHNIFTKEQQRAIIDDMKKYGTLKE